LPVEPNAAAIAGLLITTEAMVTERPKKDGEPRLCLAVAWAVWTTKLCFNRNDEGPGFLRGLFSLCRKASVSGGGFF
jgi:hypothetical protein